MIPSLTALARSRWPDDPRGVHLHEADAAVATITRVMEAPPSTWGWWTEVLDAIEILKQLPPAELAAHRHLLLSLMDPTNADIAAGALEAFETLTPTAIAASTDQLRVVVHRWSDRHTPNHNTNEFLCGVLGALSKVVRSIYAINGEIDNGLSAVPSVALALEQLGNPILHTRWPKETLALHRDHIDVYVNDVLRHLPMDERVESIVAYATFHRGAASMRGVSNVLHMIDVEALGAWRGVVSRLPMLANGGLSEVSAWATEAMVQLAPPERIRPRASSPPPRGRSQ